MSFRYLDDNDRDELEGLFEFVESNATHKDWWPPIRQEVRDHFFDFEWMRFVGNFEDEHLVAVAGLFLHPFVHGHEAEAAGLDPADVAEIGRCVVHPSCRGKNLMFSMSKQLVDRALMMDKTWIIAAVHPDNVAGRKSLEQLGMTEKGFILQDDIYPRCIYAMHV